MDNLTPTWYAVLGENKIQQLVDAFYERVYADPILQPIFANSPIASVKDKQFRFLCQFLGGPTYYNEKYGHPRMRMRHLAHPIDQNARDAWLNCMRNAIQTLGLSATKAEALYQSFPRVADHMVNR
ncbi:MAG: hypothetical protein JJT77_02115 [Crocinitomicaceae bacterium]|nr:hypothetical protein [Crocinitomicaceae bacterium]